jgi:hypothetical protein
MNSMLAAETRSSALRGWFDQPAKAGFGYQRRWQRKRAQARCGVGSINLLKQVSGTSDAGTGNALKRVAELVRSTC